MKKILIVDDNTELRGNLTEVLKTAGYHTEAASNGPEAIEKVSVQRYDAIFLDLMMPKMDGMTTLTEIKKLAPSAKIIMITAFATINNAIDAIKKGASDYLPKPFKIEDLLRTLDRNFGDAGFEDGINSLSMDNTLNALTNTIRRKIFIALSQGSGMRLMEITRRLGEEDHTKVIFHLKVLVEAGLVEHTIDKLYILTHEGVCTAKCLKILEGYLGKG